MYLSVYSLGTRRGAEELPLWRPWMLTRGKLPKRLFPLPHHDHTSIHRHIARAPRDGVTTPNVILERSQPEYLQYTAAHHTIPLPFRDPEPSPTTTPERTKPRYQHHHQPHKTPKGTRTSNGHPRLPFHPICLRRHPPRPPPRLPPLPTHRPRQMAAKEKLPIRGHLLPVHVDADGEVCLQYVPSSLPTHPHNPPVQG